MSHVNRRAFVATVATSLPVLATSAAAAKTSAASAQPSIDSQQQQQLDTALLRALADAVLPSELGDNGMRAAIEGFQRWLTDYEPVAEVNHGYGTGALEYLPAHPRPGWSAQLQALDLEARKRSGRAFAELGVDARREMLRRQIGNERTLPAPYDARHVAIGLLAWWCATPGATDLAYRARIGRESCRALADSPNRPAAIEEGS